MFRLAAPLFLLFTVACAHVAPIEMGTTQLIEAAPSKGFHYPYVLRMPKEARATYLLVEPNNTGKVSDDLAVHTEAARALTKNAVGAYVATKLDVPLLVPVFPRPQTNWQIYTHALDRDAMEIASGPMRRLDLQLLAMIDDARARLRASGVKAKEQVLLTGFSASGTFANRFTIMHPEHVRAVAIGGFNALLMIPRTEVDSHALPYPLGIADLRQLTGTKFELARWRSVPQFIYMGAKDDNDAVLFDDGYSAAERALVHRVYTDRMMPDRWARGQALYRELGANATFRTYEDVGHSTDKKIADEVTDFFRAAMR